MIVSEMVYTIKVYKVTEMQQVVVVNSDPEQARVAAIKLAAQSPSNYVPTGVNSISIIMAEMPYNPISKN